MKTETEAKTSRTPRVLIAAAGSGSGKTTIVCGLLSAFRRRGLSVCAYKVGPDYIDPDHHRAAGRCPAYSLDTWLTPPETMTALFAWTAEGSDLAVVEGVMGLYDGGRGGIGSSAEIAKRLKLPVVLAINAQSVGESAAAVALGFREYDREVDLRGVILNRLGSPSHGDIIAEALARVGIPLLGALARDEALTLPERHLGLVPAGEAPAGRLELAGAAVESGVDLDAILALARSAPPLHALPMPRAQPAARGVQIAVARDDAFSFYYPDSLMALETRGAELVFFSPMADGALPEAHGLILGGGFPEVFAQKLEDNVLMRRSVNCAAERGLPILAECGGLMYLTRSITDFGGQSFEMAGVIPARCRMHKRLQAVGYVEATALRDTVICPAGTVLRGHEFHFSSMIPDVTIHHVGMSDVADGPEDFPSAFSIERKRTGAACPGGYAKGDVLASYLHLNLMGAPDAANHFLRRCAAFRARNGATA